MLKRVAALVLLVWLIPRSGLAQDFYGLSIGASFDDIAKKYPNLTGAVARDPDLGPYIHLGQFPEDPGNALDRRIYLDQNQNIYRIEVNFGATSTQRFSAAAAMDQYYRYRENLASGYKVVETRETTPPSHFLCDGGSANARRFMDEVNHAQLSLASRVVLASHCGAIPSWRTAFQTDNPDVYVELVLDPREGGGVSAEVAVWVSNPSAEKAFQDFLKTRNR